MKKRAARHLVPSIRRSLIASLFAVVSTTSACSGDGEGAAGTGGAGGGSGGSGGAEVMEGTLVGPIAGLSYQTDTGSGVTGEDGSFLYRTGESVRFFVGQTEFGEATGAPAITLFDLVDDAEPVRGESRIRDALFANDQAFDSVINRAVLLSSFDQDEDPGNGVTLTAESREVFDSISVPFEESVFTFGQSVPFRSTLNEANSRNLFGAHRVPRLAELAAADLYSWISVDPDLFIAGRSTFDSDADGAEEGVTTQEVNEVGQRILFSEDTDADGLEDRGFRQEYDASGRLVVFEAFMAEALVSRGTIVRDMNGDRILEELDMDGNGSVDNVKRVDNDDWGREIRLATDLDADGFDDTIETFEYDSAGRRTRQLQDIDADGAVDRETRTTFDMMGRVVSFEIDDDGNGTIDSVETTTYNDDGTLSARRTVDGTGTLLRSTVVEYDEDGNQVASFADTSGDGVINVVIRFVRDAQGRVIEESFDQNNDGMLESAVFVEYNDDGTIARQAFDGDGDGAIDTIRTFAYNQFGNRIRIEDDTDADGDADEIELNTYIRSGWQVVID